MSDEVINYYVNLLIIQYNNKSKARATIDLYVRNLIDNDIVQQVRDGFNLETAVGKQLDILGEYLGVDRFYTRPFDLEGDYYSFTTYQTYLADNEAGMTNYANYTTDVGDYVTYENLKQSQTMNDDDYRLILKLKIIQNNSDHTNRSIDEGLFRFFGTDLVMSDPQNMSIFYFATDSTIRIAQIALDKKVLPRPMGVGIGGIILRNKKFFGFVTYETQIIPSNITGFTDYTAGFTKEGEILDYNKLINF